jgi:putative membrane protein
MLLLDTIVLRPYVFVFFLLYLAGSTLHLGLNRAILFGIAGYGIAWLSEFSSIHTGFPYGLYHYIETTRGQEIWVLGVPFMDSLSYVFLAYASYSVALLILSPVRKSPWLFSVLETRKIRNSLFTTFLGTFLFVYLDIIIDPVALQGDRWFLGRLYAYPEGGVYFGVPLSNFAGWFLTGFLMLRALQEIDHLLAENRVPDYIPGQRAPWRLLVGPALYAGVLIFNLLITFFIGERLLGIVGLFTVLLPSVIVAAVMKLKLSMRDPQEEWAAHLRDFPTMGAREEAGRLEGHREE